MKEQKLGHGISVQGFESMEEMFAYQAEQEARATAETLPEQWLIDRGSYVFRAVEGLAIWGHIFTRDEFLGDEKGDEELLAEWEDLEDAYTRGYRYGKYYSVVEPTGEYGSAHVVTLWAITKQDFEQARMAGWKVPTGLIMKIGQEIGEARARQNDTMKGREE